MATASTNPWFPPIRTFNDADYRSREWLAAWYTQYQLSRWIPQQPLAKSSTSASGEQTPPEIVGETRRTSSSSPTRRSAVRAPSSPPRAHKQAASPIRMRSQGQIEPRFLGSVEAERGKEEEIRHLQHEQLELEQQLQKEKALSVKQEWRVKELLDEVHQLEQETATANRKRLQAERLAAARAQRERQQNTGHFLPVSPTTRDDSQRGHSSQPLVPAQPALIIDVAESEGCPSGQIEVYPGDRARDLAHRFGQLHRLDSTNVDRLEKAIQRAIDTNL